MHPVNRNPATRYLHSHKFNMHKRHAYRESSAFTRSSGTRCTGTHMGTHMHLHCTHLQLLVTDGRVLSLRMEILAPHRTTAIVALVATCAQAAIARWILTAVVTEQRKGTTTPWKSSRIHPHAHWQAVCSGRCMYDCTTTPAATSQHQHQHCETRIEAHGVPTWDDHPTLVV